ncbi:alpha-D-QuiNAc alpha-1,3-galactosyltransferase [Lentisphaera araneosa HTCC2155]|uniref:Alpha-D-QuiNAc alpha-1,3-galactosyltransferase n=1 Tax=Lentisphaera araneosa HTCC2155 TaxID=313628 RepID=A6DHF0_9BACT|nr:glycosyltransferase family 4 protein [Lentisphaera araneosa]EDM29033.1 alpha-D-QuiNAc alpha-1,3-galactosyltransferase [Lentisphaera araneosa HTCC2155]
MSKKILYFITEDWVFCSHRLPLAVAAKKAGYDVAVVTNVKAHGERIQKAGIRVIPYNLDRGSMNPFKAVSLILQLTKIYRLEKPDLVHQVAIKPILLGTIAARLAGVPHVVNAITGMGYIFTSQELKARLLRPFINFAFKFLLNDKNSKLIMQNQDDISSLIENKVISKDRTVLIRGAGVNIKEFDYTLEAAEQPPIIVLPARMLRDKGVVEFVSAVRILKERGIAARFALVGDVDYQNPAAISEHEMDHWVNSNLVEWWGRRDDMPKVLEKSHIVCLPSYREGLPKALLEAASCGRAIVTTDVVGCREIVRDGENGLLVPLFSTVELADALHTLIEDPKLRQRMGKQGRKIVKNEFTIERVIKETLLVYGAWDNDEP